MSCVATGRRDCTFTVSPLVAPLTQLDRTLAAASDVWSLDLNRLVCPRFPVCDAIVRGLIVRRDHTHLTATYARALADSLPIESISIPVDGSRLTVVTDAPVDDAQAALDRVVPGLATAVSVTVGSALPR